MKTLALWSVAASLLLHPSARAEDPRPDAACPNCAQVESMRPREPEIVDYNLAIQTLEAKVRDLGRKKIEDAQERRDAQKACPNCALLEAMKPRPPTLQDYDLALDQYRAEMANLKKLIPPKRLEGIECPNCALLEALRPRAPTIADYELAIAQLQADRQKFQESKKEGSKDRRDYGKECPACARLAGLAPREPSIADYRLAIARLKEARNHRLKDLPANLDPYAKPLSGRPSEDCPGCATRAVKPPSKESTAPGPAPDAPAASKAGAAVEGR